MVSLKRSAKAETVLRKQAAALGNTIENEPPPDHVGALCDALTVLETPNEARAFLRDICSPAELKALAERWRIALLLDAGDLSYREIAAETGASTTTVGRVSRFLKDEPHQGYRTIIDRLYKK